MSLIKILPVFPEFPPSFWSYRYAVELVRKKATMPPTGLATVAAMLPRDKFEVLPIRDLNTSKLDDEYIKNSDLVMLSAMIAQRESTKEVIDRAHFYGKKIIAGGPYPTSYRDEVSADYLVLDEAEVTLAPFLEDLLNGNPSKIYDARTVRGRTLNTRLTKGGKPLITNTPIPRWDLLNLNDYSSLAVQYSRGCPFDCEFCDITSLFGRESRTKTPEQMIKEFEAIKKTGWRGSIFIVDDNFIGKKDEVRKMLPILASWQEKHNYPFALFTEASMDLAMPANKDIREYMIKAGFDSVFTGIESPDPDVLAKMKKRQNAGYTTPAEKVKILQESGFEVMGGFIIGADGEKQNVFENMFEFIQSSGIVIPMAGLMTALRNTALHRRLELEGRLISDTTGNNTHNLSFNFKTQMDEKFLLDGYANLLGKLFDSKNFYDRCRVQESRRGIHHTLNRANGNGAHAFTRLLYENAIERPDKEFFKYLLEVAVTHPSKFPEAVSQAAKLRHFRTMTENTFAVADYKKKTNSLYEDFHSKVAELKEDANDKWNQFASMEKRLMEKAREGYERIHQDFRKDAQRHIDDLTNKVSQLKQSFYQGSKTQIDNI